MLISLNYLLPRMSGGIILGGKDMKVLTHVQEFPQKKGGKDQKYTKKGEYVSLFLGSFEGNVDVRTDVLFTNQLIESVFTQHATHVVIHT